MFMSLRCYRPGSCDSLLMMKNEWINEQIGVLNPQIKTMAMKEMHNYNYLT